MTRILIVDDDAQLRRALQINLAARGFQVTVAVDGRAALRAVAEADPEIVILDLGLPDVDGVQVLGAIRQCSSIPVIVLSARVDSADKVEALDLGADDYVTKPFGMEELLARLRAAIRRATSPQQVEPVVTTDSFTVDLAAKQVIRDGAAVHLTPTEWGMLEVLVRRRGGLVTQAELLREVWGPEYNTETNYLRVYLAQLRRKLEPEPAKPRHLLTDSHMGYRFQM
jgi:two-component system KDP operon response regulator KdpE